MTNQKYWIWSTQHQMWWEPEGMGYTHEITLAGVFDNIRWLRGYCNDALYPKDIAIPCSPLAPHPTLPITFEEIWKAGWDYCQKQHVRSDAFCMSPHNQCNFDFNQFLDSTSEVPTKRDDQEESQSRQQCDSRIDSIQEQIHCLRDFLQGLVSSLQSTGVRLASDSPSPSELINLLHDGLVNIQHRVRHTLVKMDATEEEKTDQSHSEDQDRQEEHQEVWTDSHSVKIDQEKWEDHLEEWQNPQGIKSEACLKLLQEQEYERKRKEYFEMVNQQMTQRPYYQQASEEKKPEPAKPEPPRENPLKDCLSVGEAQALQALINRHCR